MDDGAAKGLDSGEAILANGGVAGPCEAGGTVAGSLALDWATVGAEFEKNCGN